VGQVPELTHTVSLRKIQSPQIKPLFSLEATLPSDNCTSRRDVLSKDDRDYNLIPIKCTFLNIQLHPSEKRDTEKYWSHLAPFTTGG